MTSSLPLPPVINKLVARALPVAPGVLVYLWVLLSAAAAAQLVWLLIPLPEQGQWRAPPVAPVIKPRSAASVDPVQLIVAADLFGKPVADAPAITSTANAPETRLNLKLVGILYNRDEPSLSRAMISGAGASTQPFAESEQVGNVAKLHRIEQMRVLLDRNGQIETLSLEKPKPGPNSQIRVSQPARDAVAAPVEQAQMLGDIRRELLQNPAQASTYLRVQPSMFNGELKGYRIYPGRERSAFNSVGLRPGDLVTSVNGVQLNDPARALQLLSDLSAASDLTVEIERGGTTQTLNLSLN